MPRDTIHSASLPTPIVKSFGEFEKRYYDGGARSHDELCDATLGHLRGELIRAGSEYLSLDVFDTLLLRNNKSERRRFWEISELWLNWLKEIAPASNIQVVDFFHARLRAARICYSCGPIVLGAQEGRLDDIVAVVLNLLGLSASHASTLIQIEIAYEAQNTRISPLIRELIAAHRATGGRIILISDMYMGSAEINDLLARHDGSNALVDETYSSADTVLNKRTGTIFNEIANRLGAPPAAFFHVGDNLLSDFLRPRLFGWNALHLPIPRDEEQLRAEDERAFDASI